MKKIMFLGVSLLTVGVLAACSTTTTPTKKDTSAKTEQVAGFPNDATSEQKAAIKKAKSYLENMHFSKEGLKKQMTSEFDQFTVEDTDYAIEFLKPDWNEQAVKAAKSYRETMNMSNDAIKTQLTSQFDQFTEEQDQYGIDHIDD